ncbi:hypothetical protein DPEC_G00018240 [Dallia pectoralis]|uniref:Uncharacterized protein n=1 Tax=Dallia pectoralis TaxID=75939 RepID=A0ACC2HFF0_DALPE|nr:hypothetical protein DPEC_G00018240 [Dallia pectoralis]
MMQPMRDGRCEGSTPRCSSTCAVHIINVVCLGHDHTEKSCTHQEICTLLTSPGYKRLECQSAVSKQD